jgi:hypothetical protein
MFCVLGFSPPKSAASWIDLYKFECETHWSIMPAMPSIIGIDNGKLLLMGRIKVKDPTQNSYPQFDVLN